MKTNILLIGPRMILKKRLFFCLFFIILFNLFELTCMSETGLCFTNNLVVRQQTKTTNGISVCGPVAIDLKILDLIRFSNMKSIDDYAKWLKKTVQYKKDSNSDTWSTPEETLAQKSGDCEDIAFLNKTFLQVLGYKPKVVALLRRGTRKGHAVCAFKEKGHYMWFDNTTLKRTTATSMQGLASYILKHSAYSRLAEISFEDSKQVVLADNK